MECGRILHSIHKHVSVKISYTCSSISKIKVDQEFTAHLQNYKDYQTIQVPSGAMCEPGNVFWVAPAKLQIDSLEKLVRAGLPPTASRVALLRLEVLLFFDRPDP